MDSAISLKSLVELAETALTAAEPDEASVNLVIEYSAAFEAWFATFDPNSPISQEDQELLKKLETMHPEVLKSAQLLLGKTSDSLKRMKVRGKTILAYTESLPKRISIFRHRKS